jgi:hypothetical protein
VLEAGARTSDVLVEDLDVDGALDVVVANRDSDDVVVLLGDGTGGFAPPVGFETPTGVAAVAAGDLDEDGIPDLVATLPDSDRLALILSAPG